MPDTHAGVLSGQLQELVASAPADSMIPVWLIIQSESPNRATALPEMDSRSFVERYTSYSHAIRDRHKLDQAEILTALDEFVAADNASQVTGHWIANIVEATIAAGQLQKLSSRSDLNRIVLAPKIELIGPEIAPAETEYAMSLAVDTNLRYIRARQAWAMGFTGRGRIICSFDTGIQGSHPALNGNWNGLNGDSLASWYDPAGKQKAPHTFPSNTSPGFLSWHGTHVMGLMTGHSGSDTVGVAPGAKWISAAVVDIPGASLISSFEWAVNPDGDWNTVHDVPDVINHSWGFQHLDCLDAFNEIIDNVESLGIVNVFAAGNEGGASSIRNPANRARDSLDCFAVGNLNLNTNPPTVSVNSSRGPSQCPPGAIKPNVLAPGTLVRSAYPVNTYIQQSGTSMATPHVSGLVALLRQKNPNATVRQIKQAILTSTQKPANLGTYPNNNAGWGVIDCAAALNALSAAQTNGNIRIYDFRQGAVLPGATLDGSLTLQNLGATIGGVTATVTGNNPYLTVQNGSISFGTISTNDTVTSPQQIRILVSPSAPPGSLQSIDIQISGTAYSRTTKLFYLIEPALVKSTASHSTGRLEFTVSNYGVFGFGSGSIFPLGGEGFTFDAPTLNELYEGGLMLGTGPARVSSAVHEYLFEPEMDFVVQPGGTLVYQEPGPDAHEQSLSSFADDSAANPIGIEVVQQTYTKTAPNNDFVLLRFILRNKGTTTVNNLYAGLFLDWDAGASYQNDRGGLESPEQILYTSDSNNTKFRGVKLIDGTLSSAMTASAAQFVYLPSSNGSDDGFTVAEKWNALTNGVGTANTYKTSAIDICQIMAAGPMSLPPGGRDTVSFALLAGNTLAELKDAAGRANSIPTDVSEDEETLPTGFALFQNYPNPFNPSTKISFLLPRTGQYELRVFNSLGQQVDVITGKGAAGLNSVIWDGEKYASGVYLYQLTTDNLTASRKMLLIK